MTLQQLRYLVAIANFGTMTAAADALYVAQSALSRALRSLENELGAELLVRDGRSVELTPLGRRVVRLARSVLDAAAAIEEVGSDAPEHDTVPVAATYSIAVVAESHLVREFMAETPGVSVEVQRCTDNVTVFDLLRSGRATLGMVDAPAPRDLRGHHLYDVEAVLVSPASLQLPNPVPWSVLDGLRMVLPARGGERRAEMEELFARLWMRPVAVLETEDRLAWIGGVLRREASLLWYRDVAEEVFGTGAAIRSFDPPLVRSVTLVQGHEPLTRSARAFAAFARRSRAQEAEADL